MLERETLSAEQQRYYTCLALLSSRGGERALDDGMVAYVRKAYLLLHQLLICHPPARRFFSQRRQACTTPTYISSILSSLLISLFQKTAAYVTNAYVPPQLLCCKRVERETLAAEQQRDYTCCLAPSFLGAATAQQRTVAYVTNAYVALQLLCHSTQGERGWQTSTQVITRGPQPLYVRQPREDDSTRHLSLATTLQQQQRERLSAEQQRDYIFLGGWRDKRTVAYVTNAYVPLQERNWNSDCYRKGGTVNVRIY